MPLDSAQCCGVCKVKPAPQEFKASQVRLSHADERPHLSLRTLGEADAPTRWAGLGSARAPMKEPHHRLGSDKPHDPQG